MPTADSRPIFITGRSLLSALGSSLDQTWNHLLAGRVLADNARVPIESIGDEPRVITLARRAATMAIDDAEWIDLPRGDAKRLNDSPERPVSTTRTALVVGTSKGTVDAWLDIPAAKILTDEGTRTVDRAKRISRGVDGVADTLSHEFGITGPALTTSAACASGLHALIRAAILLRSGEADRAIVVAAESSLHPLFLASFDRLGVLARRGEVCRPFDHDRRGFFVAEAAAAVCLETFSQTSSPRRRHPTLSAFGLAADATHLTGQDETGRVLGNLISQVVAGRPIDFVHAHGTGTRLNDPAELAAIQSALGDNLPPIYSHKAALGHTLGTAGLVATVLTLESFRHQLVPPNVATRHPLDAAVSVETTRRPIRRAAITVAGFGGALATVIVAE